MCRARAAALILSLFALHAQTALGINADILVTARADILVTARRALDAGRPKAAYEQLVAAQFERAGDPEYDYLLGLCALASGFPTQAMFALERVMALRPDDLRVRTAVGQAHLALKETDAARREFQTVQSKTDSEESRRVIERYLSAVDQVESAAKFSLHFFAELAAGYDSNVNSATSQQQVAIPGLGGISFTLAPASRQKSDEFLSLAGGVQARRSLTPLISLFGGVAASTRFHLSETNYEPSYFDANFGLSGTRGADTLSVALQFNHFYVNDSSYSAEYRETLGGMLQWLHNFEGVAQLSLYAQLAALSHPDQKPRDATRAILGGAYAMGFDSGASVFAGAYFGVEKERASGYAYLGHRPIGVRAGGDWPWTNRWSLFTNASVEHRRYRGVDPLALVVRKEWQYSSSMGMNYRLAKHWRLSPQISYTVVRSNFDVNNFDRVQAQVLLRGEF